MSECERLKQHQRPVHLNRGRHGHVWMCIACRKQLSGPVLPDAQLDAVAEMLNSRGEKPLAKQAERQRENDMQMEIKVLAGAESKAFLAGLTQQIDRLERLTGGKGLKADNDDAPADTAGARPLAALEEGEEDFAPKKAAKKKAAAFDEEEEEEEIAPAAKAAAKKTAASFDEEEEEAPAPKAKKAPKVTIDDVNDACMEKMRALGGNKKAREQVVAILKKKFKVETVTELKPEQYADAVEAMQD